MPGRLPAATSAYSTLTQMHRLSSLAYAEQEKVTLLC
jgi:hypothetical protein